MKILALALLLTGAASAHAADDGSINLQCISTTPNSQLGNLVIYDAQFISTFNPNVYSMDYAGVGGDWDGAQIDIAAVNADGTISFDASNECDSGFDISFNNDELKAVVAGAKTSISGTVDWGSSVGPQTAHDAIQCKVIAPSAR